MTRITTRIHRQYSCDDLGILGYIDRDKWTLDGLPRWLVSSASPLIWEEEFVGEAIMIAGERMSRFEAFDILDIAQMWRDGTPPNAGGALDQPNRLRILSQFVWSQEQKYEAEALKKLRK